MIFVSLIATCVLQWFLFRKRGLQDPSWILFITYLYYTYFVPIAMVATSQYDLLLIEQPIWVNEPDLQLTALTDFLGFAGIAGGYWWVTNRFPLGQTPAPRPVLKLLNDFASPRVMVGVTILYVTLMFTVFYEQTSQVLQGYDQKIEINYNNSTYSFIVANMLLLLSTAMNYLILMSKRYYTTTIVAVTTFIFLSFALFTKQPFIFAALAGICTLARWKKIPAFPLVLGISTVAVIALIYAVPIFAVYRAEGEFTLKAYQQVSIASVYSDAIGPFGVMIYTFNGYLHVDGHPLWQSAILWVPRFLWVDRPIDLGEDFARQVIANWQPGFGVAFSPIAEGYARFGLPGVPLLLAACGAGVATFERLCARIAPVDARPAVALTVSGYLALSVLRNPFSGLFTQGIQISIPIGLVALMSFWIQRRQDRREKFNATAIPAA